MWSDVRETCYVELQAPLTVTQPPIFPPQVWTPFVERVLLF